MSIIERFRAVQNTADYAWDIIGVYGDLPKGLLYKDLKEAADRIEALEAALKNAENGFDRIHQALLRTGPKQACGEMTMHFLTKTRAAVSQMESNQ